MFIRVFVSGAMGDTKNLLDVLVKARAIYEPNNSGETISFTLRPPTSVVTLGLEGLWAGNVAELIARTPNISCEVHDA